MKVEISNERWAFVSTEGAGRRESRFALTAVFISALVFVAVSPFARTPMAQYPVFIPIYVSTLVLSDLITATLLLGQYSVIRTLPVLVLAAGYLFTASITAAYALIFPGLFAPSGLLGSGPQTSSAMYMFWHAGFPLVILCYALLESRRGGDEILVAPGNRGSARTAILATVAGVLLVTVGYTVFATSFHAAIPVFLEGNRTTPLGHLALSGIWLLSFAALAVLWRRKPHTVLDVWLMVVMWVWLFDIALAAILNTGRYDLGWYAGRIYGLVAASALLIVLLVEDIRHYARLVQMSVDLKAANRALALLSRHDELTGIANRRLFDEEIAEQIALARRHQRPLALVLCDVDHFKNFNDRHGHPAGDACLRQVATVLRNYCKRPGDVAARYGGEEFAMIFPATDILGAVHTAEAAREAVSGLDCDVGAGECTSVSMSCGVAGLLAGMTAQELVKAADEALYLAKDRGRNQVVCTQEIADPEAVATGLSAAPGWLRPPAPAAAHPLAAKT